MFDLKEIKQQFMDVISYSQGIEQPNVDALFDNWLEAKRDIIEAMGGRLIYQYPEKVEFKIDENTKEQRINDFIDSIEGVYENQELACFVEDMRDGFYENKTLDDWDNYNIYVPKGAKIVKAFKYFEKNRNALEALQNEASRLIQQDSISGYLRISVHPLDFLSLSENSHNWRSCHALDNDYRAGNLSYMGDKSTFICYLCDDKDCEIPNFPFEWNSKKWRTLMFFSDDWRMMFAGRQYPFESQLAIDFVKDVLLDECGLCRGCKWTPWDDKTIRSVVSGTTRRNYHLSANYYPVGHHLVSAFELIKDPKFALHFNDLLYSNSYEPMYSFRITNPHAYYASNFGDSTPNTRFHIGSDVMCLRCGRKKIRDSNLMWCIDCEEAYGSLVNEDYGYCSCCERHIHEKHSFELANGDIVCLQCKATQTDQCEICGDYYYREDLTYDRQKNKLICKHCLEGVIDYGEG